MNTRTITFALSIMLFVAIISFCYEPKTLETTKEKLIEIVSLVYDSWDVPFPGFSSDKDFYAQLTGTPVASK
ncbi:MAG: hypothetical protein V2I62_07020 [Bacteroidales bacterium]|jgi:hypothetical protein|nr:hypothetical protein [Bacteroidales bacterium]